MMAEKIKLVLVKRNMSKAQLAKELGCSSSNLYNKFKRDNFSEAELKEIAKLLNCTFEASFVLNDTQERFLYRGSPLMLADINGLGSCSLMNI